MTISQITPEQEALIPVYREKWRNIALSTVPIDREKAADAVQAAYAVIGLEKPEIIFYDSPLRALEQLGHRLEDGVASEIDHGLPVKQQLESQVLFQIKKQLEDQIKLQLRSKMRMVLYSPVQSEMESYLERTGDLTVQYSKQLSEKIAPELWGFASSLYDYYIAVLNCQYSRENWDLFQGIVRNCGWMFPYEKICLMCDRPRVLSFDDANRLHSEASRAIEFADGFGIYAYHGVTVPEQYGKLYPEQWRSEWILSEENAELRRVLIQGIGYDRICQELQASPLDSWQEYSLLRIDDPVDEEEIYLLKMTCPSTGFIHALRVPPDVKSAREAIKWVNWGIDPSEFSTQS